MLNENIWYLTTTIMKSIGYASTKNVIPLKPELYTVTIVDADLYGRNDFKAEYLTVEEYDYGYIYYIGANSYNNIELKPGGLSINFSVAFKG